MKIIYWLIIATIIAIIPVFLIKEYILTKQSFYLLLAMLCYFIMMKSYVHIFTESEVSSAYVLLQILQIFIVVIPSIILFGETISLNKIAGIILGSISIYLLS
jgi:multidrug transporter EmrE-like cation transporter